MAEWKKVIVSGSNVELNTINASGHILPVSDDASDLGSTAKKFKDLHLDGTANVDALAAVTADIDGGTIDGATIATSDITVGAGKTLNVSAGTLTTSAAQNKAILQSGIANNDANVDFQGFEVRAQTFESDVATGTAPFVVASTTQVANLNASTLGGADFASPGTIGGTAPGVANFTTLNASAITSLNGDVNLGNAAADDVNLKGHLTASAGIHISGSATSTGSFGKLFGDGSALTGVTQNIDELSNYGAQTIHQTQDHFLISDNTIEKKITFSDLEDSIFANVNGDIQIAAGGAATIQPTSVENSMLAGSIANDKLANSTISGKELGNNLDSLSVAAAGGIGMTSYNGSAAVSDLALDIDGMTDIGAGLASGDLFIVDDGAGGTNRKTAVDRIATLFAGNGLSDSSAVMSVDPDGSTLSVSSDGVKVAGGGITGTELNSSVAGNGLTGGGGSALAVGAGTGVTVNANDIAIGQDVATNANVTFADIRATGNLTVEGTTVNAQVANLNVEDRFILLNSGSAAGDGGIVVQTESAFSGSAFAYDDSESRWGFQQVTKLGASAVTAAPDAYAVAVWEGDTPNAAYQKNGNMQVDSSGDIYIYVES